MASINFIGGEKGGVGKSVVARLLAQYFIDKGRAFTGFRYRSFPHLIHPLLRGLCSPLSVVDNYEGLDHIAGCVRRAASSGPATPCDCGLGGPNCCTAGPAGFTTQIWWR